MNEIYTSEMAGWLGVTLAIGWAALNILGCVWDWTWAWIDDSRDKATNPFIRGVAKIMGYKYRGRGYSNAFYHDKDDVASDGAVMFFLPAVLLIFIPFAVLMYEITLAVVSAIALAHLARYARRHKKVFDKHVEDKDAHQ